MIDFAHLLQVGNPHHLLGARMDAGLEEAVGGVAQALGRVLVPAEAVAPLADDESMYRT